MRVRALFAALLLLAAGVQNAEAQGFRVYKSDGTVAQFSLRSDSIVFYDGIGSDQDFGPFTPVNEPIVGQWYRSKSEWITFNADGTTSGWDNAWGQGLNGDFVYRFFPYQGNVVVYERETDKPVFYLHLLEVRSDRLVMASSGMEAQSLVVLTRTSRNRLWPTSFRLMPTTPRWLGRAPTRRWLRWMPTEWSPLRPRAAATSFAAPPTEATSMPSAW